MHVYEQSRASSHGEPHALSPRAGEEATSKRSRAATQDPAPTPRPPNVRALHSIDNSAVHDEQLFASFLELYLSKGLSIVFTTTWVHEALNLVDRGPALHWALKSLSMSRLGWHTQDKNLLRDGRLAYPRALSELQRALNDTILVQDDTTLAATRALLLYETIEPTNDNIEGWIRHHQGSTSIVCVRRPESFQTSFGIALLDDVRECELLYCLLTRRTSLMPEVFWGTRLWRDHEAATEHKLSEQGIALTTLLQDFDRPHNDSTGGDFSAPALAILTRCDLLDAALQSLETSHTSSGLEVYESDADTTGAQTMLRFSDSRQALLAMNIWCFQLILTTVLVHDMHIHSLTALQPASPVATTSDAHDLANKLSNRHDLARMNRLARSILDAVSYCFGQGLGLYGAQRSVLALRIVRLHYEQVPAEEDAQKCTELYNRLVHEKGVKLAMHMDSLVVGTGHSRGL